MEEEQEREMRGKIDEDDIINEAESEELEETREIHSEDEDEDQEQDQDDGEEEDDDEDEEDGEETAAQLRESLASVPFEVLQALKKKGDAKALDRRNDPTPAKEEKKGKNQPLEASSKRRPPRFIDFGTIPRNTQRKSRDPRFDSLSGKFNEDLFQKSYSFVEDYKQEELNELNEQLRKEKDPEEKERIALGVRLLHNQIAVTKRDAEQKTKKTARKKMERELVLQGKKPFFPKKSDEKTLELLEKFTDLKQKGQLDKYLVKKKRRNAAREHTRIPWQRRAAGGE